MKNSTPVIVTRPAGRAAVWVKDLSAHGHAAESLPLIAIQDEPLSGPLRAAREHLAHWHAVLFVSGSAARSMLRRAPELGAPDYFAARAWAPGRGTAQALRAAGWPAEQIDTPAPDAAQFDSEALWAEVSGQIKPGTLLLIVRGGDAAGHIGGRPWLAQRAEEAGAEVEQLLAYRRVLPSWSDAQHARMEAAATDGSIWLFSSGQALRHLQQLGGAVDWSAARAIVTHPRIGESARALGFQVIAETRPHVDDVLAALNALD